MSARTASAIWKPFEPLHRLAALLLQGGYSFFPLFGAGAVFLPRCHAAADVALLLVGGKHRLHPLLQHGVERFHPRGDILMFGGCGYAETGCGLAHSRVRFNHVLREPYRTFLG